MSSPHYKPGTDSLNSSIFTKDGNKFIIKPRALEIIWGGDNRYWRIPDSDKPTDPVELLQVSWLEVTGSLGLDRLQKGIEYKVSFKLKLKPDAFGWADSPVYLMAKPGKSEKYIWKKSDLSLWKPGEPFSVPDNPVLKFKVPESAAAGDKLQFGMYEIWKGRWKGGLVIDEVVIEPVTG